MKFEEFIDGIREALVSKAGMSVDDANAYTKYPTDWEDYYINDFSPRDAVAAEMSYWE